MSSTYSKKDYYGIWQGLFKKSWFGSEHDEWFKITSVSYYLDYILYSVVISTPPKTEICIRMVMSSNSRIKVMLDQENDQSRIKDG